MRLKNLTSLARPIDFKYKTNLFVFIATVLISVFFNLNQAFYFFLAWAIAREIDIDNPLSAFLASTFVFLGYFYFVFDSMYVILFILITLRAITNITGIKIKLIDYIFMIFLFFLSLSKLNLNFYLTNFLTILVLILIFDFIFLKKKNIKTKCDNNNKKVKVDNYKKAIIFLSLVTIILNSYYFGLIILGILVYNIATGGVA